MQQEIRHEFEHLRSHWWWLLVLGAILVACGTAAIVVPDGTIGLPPARVKREREAIAPDGPAE
jgi:hypothetical protein